MTGSQPRIKQFKVRADDVYTAVLGWCPYAGHPAFKVRFKASYKLVCLACGEEH